MQLILAGKAHPGDEEGKALIQQWARFAGGPRCARTSCSWMTTTWPPTELVQGVDVWINTPRRPWEACGTSGMKVLVNGGLNLSSWTAGGPRPSSRLRLGARRRDRATDDDAAGRPHSCTRCWRRRLIPAFYDRDADGFPRRWIARMRASMAPPAPRFSSARMLQDYIRMRVPAGRVVVPHGVHRGERISSRDPSSSGRSTSNSTGTDIRFGEITETGGNGRFILSVPVLLGEITPQDVHVELYANPEHANPPFVQRDDAGRTDRGSGQRVHLQGDGRDCPRPAWHFTPRVVPFHPDARVPIELPLIAWQR